MKPIHYNKNNVSSQVRSLFFKVRRAGRTLVAPIIVVLSILALWLAIPDFIRAAISSPVSNVSPGWSKHKHRAVFYNGSRFFLIYSKGDTSLYYKSSTDNVTWSGESTLMSSTASNVFDIYLVSDSKFDLVYKNAMNYHYVVTCTISGGTITAGSSSSTWLSSVVSPEVVAARSGSGDRIYVACAAGDRLRIYSANQTGDAENITSWTTEIDAKESPEDIAMVPYQNSDKVLLINSEYKFGGIYSQTITHGSGRIEVEIGNFSNIPDFSSPVRILDTDFRVIVRPPAAAMEEWKFNGSTWSQVDANIDPDNETDQGTPSLFYDRISGDMYAFSIDTTDDNVERHKKPSGGSWQAEEVVDDGEATAHTLPITQMHEPPYGSSRTVPRELVWAYRVYNDPNYDLKVGNLNLATITGDHMVVTATDGVALIGSTEVLSLQLVDQSGSPISEALPVTVSVTGSAVFTANDIGGTNGSNSLSGTLSSSGSGSVTITNAVMETVTISADAEGDAEVVANVDDAVEFNNIAPWYNSNWQYRKRIRIDSSRVAGDLDNFPVLINTTDENLRYSATPDSVYHVGKNNGGDILFTTFDGTKLDHEIERYDSNTGELVAWVEVPSLLGSSDTNIFIYYGYAGAADQWNETGTWDEGGDNYYKGVWHLDETPADDVQGHTDSTSNPNDGTPKNFQTGGGSTDATGRIDGADDFAGDDDYVTIGDHASLDVTSQVTVEAWTFRDTTVASAHLISKGYWDTSPGYVGSYLLNTGISGDKLVFYVNIDGAFRANASGSTTIPNGKWTHCVGTYDGNYIRTYVNGELYDTSFQFTGSITTGANDVAIGANVVPPTPTISKCFDGRIDEVRISSVARSAEWIKTSYNNQLSPSGFYTMGIEETEGTDGAPFGNGWSYRKKIIIQASEVPSDQTNFPVMIRTTDPDWAYTTSGGEVEQTDGGDILFTKSDEVTKLDHEIEKYEPSSGKLVAWVEVSLLSSSEDTLIYIYYGNATAVNQENPTGAGVWEPNYKGVWHLKEDPSTAGSEGIKDSTSYTNHGTDDGTMDASDSVDGRISKALDFDESTSDHIDISSNLGLRAYPFTFSAWVQKRATGSGNIDLAVSLGDKDVDDVYYGAGVYNDDKFLIEARNTSHTQNVGSLITAGLWYYIVAVFESDTSKKLYRNGNNLEATLTDSVAFNAAAIDQVNIGKRSRMNDINMWDGIIDEVRISNTARSVDWIQTSYNNQKANSTFYSVEEECEGKFTHRRPININSSKVSNTEAPDYLTDFPVLISLSYTSLRSTAYGGNVQHSEGYDIIFRDSTGETQLDHEIEAYDENNGTLLAWVRIPTLSKTSNTLIYMYYGNCAITSSTENPTGVWDPKYVGVWHLKEEQTGTGNPTLYQDSTSSDNDGGDIVSATGQDGQIDGGQQFDGTDDYVDLDSNIGDYAFLSVGSVSLWFKYTDTSSIKLLFSASCNTDDSSDLDIMYHSTDNVFMAGIREDGGTQWIANLPANYADGFWHHYVMTVDSSGNKHFIDGSQVTCQYLYGGSASTQAFFNSVTGLNTLRFGNRQDSIGNEYHFAGYLDEVRISNIALPADWIKTEKNNQSDPSTFHTVGDEEDLECVYSYYKQITIQSSQVSGTSDLSNFPALVSLSGSWLRTTSEDPANGHIKNANGYDIIFKDSGGTQLDHEIEEYDGTASGGTLVAWVKIPTLKYNEDTIISIYYGNSCITSSTENVPAVWDSNYKAVWHLKETPTVDTYAYDSTSNDNDGTFDSSMTSDDQVSGQMINGSLNFDGANDYIGVSDSASLGLTSIITIESWFNPDETLSGSADHFQSLIDSGSYSLFFDKSDGKIKFVLNSNTTESWNDVGSTALNEKVYALATYKGELYVGGFFTDAAGDLDADYIAKWNGSSWSDVGGIALSGKVYTLTVYNGELYAGGQFNDLGSNPNADKIAKWNGTSWSDVGGNPLTGTDTVYAFAVYKGELYVAGNFDDAAGDPDADMIAKWNGTSWSDVGGIALNSGVIALAVYNDELYVGGSFTDAASNTNADKIAKWNGTSWSDVGGNPVAETDYVYALAVYNGELYLGGNFSDAAGDPDADMIAKWNGTSWSDVGGTALDAYVHALAVYNGELYIGGDFMDAGGNGNADYIAKWNGTSWSDVGGTALNGTVYAFTTYKSELYVGGFFQDVGTTNGDSIAKFSSGDDIELGTTSTSWAASIRHHIAATYSGASVKIHVNGTEEASTSSSITLEDLSFDVLIGKSYGTRGSTFGSGSGSELFNGLIDEVRISDIERSADWIKTSYNNQSDPSTFYVIGGEAENVPTAVDLISFTATGQGPSVVVEWETAQEINNLGFNLYRSPELGGTYSKLNLHLIPGLLSSVIGQQYAYVDKDVTRSVLYYYMLEDVDLSGTRTMHGPVCVDWDGDGIPDDYIEEPDDEDDSDTDPEEDDPEIKLPDLEFYEIDFGPEGWTPSSNVGSATWVRLAFFRARQEEEGVSLEWETGYEVDNLGFHIYREVDGEFYRITTDLVPGSVFKVGAGRELPAGQDYVYFDGLSRCTGQELYWLDCMELNGGRVTFGPIEPEVSAEPVSERLRARFRSISKHQISRAEAFRKVRTLREELSNRKIQELKSQAVFYQFVPDTLFEPRLPPSEKQWALSARSAVKISIKEDGWYRIEEPELVAAGLDSGVDPRFLQLYADGEEQSMRVTGSDDGRFDPEDGIEFHGTGLDTPFTDTRVYWLVVGDRPGRRLDTPFTDIRVGPDKRMRIPRGLRGRGAPLSFPYTVELKERTFYFAALKNGEGESFFGSVISTDPVSQLLSVWHADPSPPEDAILEVVVQGATDYSHQINIQLNYRDVGQMVFSGQERGAVSIQVSQGFLLDGDNIVTLAAQGGDQDISLVDYIRLIYWRTYTADDDALKFTAMSGEWVSIGGFSSPEIRVVDITHSTQMFNVRGRVKSDGSGYAITFKVPRGGERTLLALSEEKIKSPSGIAANLASSWHEISWGADIIIISYSDLLESIRSLKELREQQGWSVVLVDVQDLYDEFNFGAKSPWALKDFLTLAYGYWNPQPRYLILVGDTSYDPRNYLGYGEFDLVPTKFVDTEYLKTASDDWFVDFNDDQLPEMAVGRLPAESSEEAETIVSKIVSYEGAAGSMNEALLVADVNDFIDFEGACGEVRRLLPGNITVREIFRGQSSTARSDLLDLLNQGQSLVNYFGHGSTKIWKGNLLTSLDAWALTNSPNLPFLVSMTCLNGFFQDPNSESLAETFMKAPLGGAVAVWTSSGLTYPGGQISMNKELIQLLFNGQGLTIGEAIMGAKQAAGNSDIRRTWILFGDPTLRLR